MSESSPDSSDGKRSAPASPMGTAGDEANDERSGYATFCPDCDALFFEDEEGFDTEVCFECGGSDCYEVPG